MERNCAKSYIFRRIQTACDNHSRVKVCEIRRFLHGHRLLLSIVNGMELCKNLCFSKGYMTLVTIIKDTNFTMGTGRLWQSWVERELLNPTLFQGIKSILILNVNETESGNPKSFRQHWSPIWVTNGNNFAKYNGHASYANVTMRFFRFPMQNKQIRAPQARPNWRISDFGRSQNISERRGEWGGGSGPYSAWHRRKQKPSGIRDLCLHQFIDKDLANVCLRLSFLHST